MVPSVSASLTSDNGHGPTDAPPQLDQDEQSHGTSLAALERVIERVGARYIADLRELSEEFSRFYEAQLQAKDEQIAELVQRARDAERAKDEAAARLDELRDARARQVAEVRALSEELIRRITEAEHDHQAPDMPSSE